MSAEDLRAENAELQRRLEEAEETLSAIRDGAVDAFVVNDSQGNRIYTLEGADRPYRLLVERMEQGAVTLYADGTIAYSNARFATLLETRHAQLTGTRLADCFPESERALYADLLGEARTRPSHGELHLQRSNGSQVPVHLTLNALPSDSGAAIGVLITDLTAQRYQEQLTAAHEALRESESRLSTFLEQLPVGVGAADLTGRWTISNAAIRRFAPTMVPSHDPERAAQWQARRADGSAIPPEEWPSSRALQGEPSSGGLEMIYTTETGAQIWTHVGSVPIRDHFGKVVGSINVVQDIDAIKRVDLALRESEERFRSLVSVLTDVPWTTDAHGTFTTPQPAWAKYTGQSWEEYRGRGWVNALHPDEREGFKSMWRDAREAHGHYEAHARLWHAPSASYRHVEARSMPLLNPDGSIREWVGTCTDIDERVRAEKQLIEADRTKDDFLAMLAHELRNPLAPIRSAAHAMKKLGLSDPNLTWSSDAIERQVTHLARIVDDLLDVSRIRRGKIDLRREAVPLEFAVMAAVEANRALIEAKQQELVIDLAPVFLLADETRLMQIVSNLLNNAAKYTHEGGRIEIRARQSGDMAELTVKDSGPGISKELLSRVFDLFAQGERSLDRSQGGLGIGLTIVKSLVELHDGQIAVKSEPGTGTEFTVTLPISKTPPAPRKVAIDRKQQAAGPRARKKVLVVDDHADGTEALTLLLRALGHETRSSFNGPSALEVAKSFVPDIVLLDIGLPGMDGYEVARRIRRLLKEKSPLLVAMTGYGQDKDKKQAFAAGFDLHLTKPVSGEAVEALFERS